MDTVVYDKIDELKQGIVSIQNGVYENTRNGIATFVRNQSVAGGTSIASVSGKGTLKYAIVEITGSGASTIDAAIKVTLDSKTMTFKVRRYNNGSNFNYVSGLLSRESIIASEEAAPPRIHLESDTNNSNKSNGVYISPYNTRKMDDGFNGTGQEGQLYLCETGLSFSTSMTISVTAADQQNVTNVYAMYVMED